MADEQRIKRKVLPTGLLKNGPEGPDTSRFALEDFLTFRLLVLARAIDRQAKRTYGELFDLSLVEWRIMAKLGPTGSATVNRLAEWMSYDKAQISRAVASLVERGFMNRAPNARDTRSAILSLTPAGEKLHAETMAVGRERQRALLAHMTPEQRKSLYEIMEVLYDQLLSEDVATGETHAAPRMSPPVET